MNEVGGGNGRPMSFKKRLIYNTQYIHKPNLCTAFLNLITNTTMTVFFALYTFRNPDSPTCWAWNQSDAAIVNPIGIPGAIDVSRWFRMWFIAGMIISGACVLYTILTWAFVATRKRSLMRASNILWLLCLVCNLVWTICGTVARFKHVGRVCSGDYFDQDLYSEVPPFQWKSGHFIFVYLIILWVFWGILMPFLLCLVWFCCIPKPSYFEELDQKLQP